MAFQIMTVHLVAFVVGAGYGKMVAASTMGVVSMTSMLGRYLVGLGSDRLGRVPALMLAYAGTTLGILSLMALPFVGSVALFLFVVFYGLSQGSAGIVMTARAADLFQGGNFGRICGWIGVANGIGEGLGAWLGGAVFDRTGSYSAAFGTPIVSLALGAAALRRTYRKGMSVQVPDCM